jgi:UDP-N-acetylglucosamine pyrophosphorylase
MSELSNISAVILAAGKGTRMKSDLPKVATVLNNKPLISHVIESIRKAGVQKIFVVVGYKKDQVISICEQYPNIEFVEQAEQLGTGHALLCSEPVLKNYQGDILVACGDVPLISPTSFSSLIKFHFNRDNSVTVLSCDVEQSKGYGRIVRDKEGNLLEIVEEKDANEQQKQINEINTGTYIFKSPEVFVNLKNINTNNAQKEYYLPDLVKIAHSNKKKAGAFKLLNALESSGINSPEDLQRLSHLIEEGRIAV